MSRRTRRIALVAALGVLVATALPFGWTRMAAAGHLFDEAAAPRVEVVLVLGAQVGSDGRPMPFLRGRLDTAGQLLRDGRARVALVSGDRQGGSGDETTAMSTYLIETWHIDPHRVVTDPYGLDTHDSCVRAIEVYGVTKALVVTQPYHLGRAVALCRSAGIDADGVGARCDGCRSLNLARNAARDYLACTKAAWDVAWARHSAVRSPPSTEIADALAIVA